MKWIVFITLIIGLLIGLIITFSLGSFLKHLKNLDNTYITKYNTEGEPEESNDFLFCLLFIAFIIYDLISLLSCTIIVLQ